MNPLLKFVVLCWMLVALPLQGFAASTMRCCDPVDTQTMVMHDDDESMHHVAERADDRHMQGDMPDTMAGDGASHHLTMALGSADPSSHSADPTHGHDLGHAKAGCAAACVGQALTFERLDMPSRAGSSSRPIAFYLVASSTAFPRALERPPRFRPS